MCLSLVFAIFKANQEADFMNNNMPSVSFLVALKKMMMVFLCTFFLRSDRDVAVSGGD